ncbi:MAG TPA: PEP-CTERM sorting domain-containing protein [Aliidongia sp.]|nr:PEP-CTERM sorting domain-containing protein [Aliidongia sp.]
MTIKFSRVITGLIALAVTLGSASTAARAALITETYQFTLSNFVNVSGGSTPSPFSEITGQVTVTFDPTVSASNVTTGLVFNSYNGPVIQPPVGFSVIASADPATPTYLLIGGTVSSSPLSDAGTSDLSLSLRFFDPTAPQFALCNEGFSCGIEPGTGFASGFTIANDPTDGWGALAGSITAIPEPATSLLLLAGMFGLGYRRLRTA